MSCVKRWVPMVLASLVCACALQSPTGADGQSSKWTVDELRAALATPARPPADRDRDADRKPAELMVFFGIERGMTAIDVMAAGGYTTEVLSVAVGPTGKVYAHNSLPMLQFNNGAYAKAIAARLENDRLPNVVRLDGDLPGAVGVGNADVAITIMNLHDLYNRSVQAAESFVKNVYDSLKPGGVFGVVDHAGNPGAENARLHRMTRQQAIDVVRTAGFFFEDESNVLANPSDDHTKGVFDASLRGKTDQFVLKFRKPK